MSHGNLGKIIKSFPPALYFSFSIAIWVFFFVYDFRFLGTVHSILYVVFTIVNLPAGLGIFFYSYSFMRTYKPARYRFYPSFFFRIPIPIDTLWYGTFILLGCLHLILFVYLIFIFILNGFSIPQPLELEKLRQSIMSQQ